MSPNDGVSLACIDFAIMFNLHRTRSMMYLILLALAVENQPNISLVTGTDPVDYEGSPWSHLSHDCPPPPPRCWSLPPFPPYCSFAAVVSSCSLFPSFELLSFLYRLSSVPWCPPSPHLPASSVSYCLSPFLSKAAQAPFHYEFRPANARPC